MVCSKQANWVELRHIVELTTTVSLILVSIAIELLVVENNQETSFVNTSHQLKWHGEDINPFTYRTGEI